MPQKNRWGPRPLLEERKWSLIPPLGVPRRARIVAVAIWSAVVFAFAVLTAASFGPCLSALWSGGGALYYILSRLAGTTASLIPGEMETTVTEESAFQVRLAFDLGAIGLLAFAGYVLLANA